MSMSKKDYVMIPSGIIRGFRYRDTILHSRDELIEAIVDELCVLLRIDMICLMKKDLRIILLSE